MRENLKTWLGKSENVEYTETAHSHYLWHAALQVWQNVCTSTCAMSAQVHAQCLRKYLCNVCLCTWTSTAQDLRNDYPCTCARVAYYMHNSYPCLTRILRITCTALVHDLSGGCILHAQCLHTSCTAPVQVTGSYYLCIYIWIIISVCPDSG